MRLVQKEEVLGLTGEVLVDVILKRFLYGLGFNIVAFNENKFPIDENGKGLTGDVLQPHQSEIPEYVLKSARWGIRFSTDPRCDQYIAVDGDKGPIQDTLKPFVLTTRKKGDDTSYHAIIKVTDADKAWLTEYLKNHDKEIFGRGTEVELFGKFGKPQSFIMFGNYKTKDGQMSSWFWKDDIVKHKVVQEREILETTKSGFEGLFPPRESTGTVRKKAGTTFDPPKPGKGHDDFQRQAVKLAATGLPEEGIIAALKEINKKRTKPHDEKDIERSARDAVEHVVNESKQGEMPKEVRDQLRKNNKKLRSDSGCTIQERQQAKAKIDEIHNQYNLEPVDWDEEDENSKTLADKMVDFLWSKTVDAAKSESNNNEAWIKIEIDGKIIPLNLGTTKAGQVLKTQWRKITGKTHSKTPYEDAIKQMEAEIVTGQVTTPVYSRICTKTDESGKQTIYYDLGDDNFTMLVINGLEFQLIPYSKSSPIFARSPDILIQTVDESADDVDYLGQWCDILNIKDKLLNKVHTIAMYLPDIETPFMFFNSEYGSGKTTAAEEIKMLVDPTSSHVTKMPEDIGDIQTILSARCVTIFDNLNKLNQDQSDALCRALTGDSKDQRMLYSDNTLYTTSYKNKKIVLTGTSADIDYPDFISRTVFYELERLPEGDTKSKIEIKAELAKLRPKVLCQIFRILVKVLKTHGAIGAKVRTETRMADFEQYGETISQALGYDQGLFQETWIRKVQEIKAEQQEQYPIIVTLGSILSEKSAECVIITGDLRNDVKDKLGTGGILIKEPHLDNVGLFTKYLKRCRGEIRNMGYEFVVGRETRGVDKGKSHITFTRIKTESLDSHI